MQTFPIFLNLRDRRVLVVGGSEAAARKVELLLSAGAQVALIADKVGGELAELIDEARKEQLRRLAAILRFAEGAVAQAPRADVQLAPAQQKEHRPRDQKRTKERRDQIDPFECFNRNRREIFGPDRLDRAGFDLLFGPRRVLAARILRFIGGLRLLFGNDRRFKEIEIGRIK